MMDPVDREKIVAAIKAAVKDTGLTQSELSRQIGKKHDWIGSKISVVREGGNLTRETVDLMKTRMPTLVEHLRIVGWYPAREKGGRSVAASRSVQHLEMQRTQKLLEIDRLKGEVLDLENRIADLKEMADPTPAPFVPKKLHVVSGGMDLDQKVSFTGPNAVKWSEFDPGADGGKYRG